MAINAFVVPNLLETDFWPAGLRSANFWFARHSFKYARSNGAESQLISELSLRLATLLSLRVQTKRQSQDRACLAKVEPRAPRHKLRRVAIADVAEKIRFHMPFREELLLAGLTFASREELLIEFCVIKA